MNKLRTKITALMMGMTLTLALLTGCAGAGGEAQNTGDSPAPVQTDAEQGATRTITDLNGNEVTLPEKVERVAFTSWPAGEAITIMLEQVDSLATLSTTNAGNELILQFYPQLAELPTTPDISEGNVEEFLAYGVQLVFTDESRRETFENAGIAVLVPDTSGPEAIMDTILMMGEAFGGESAEKAQTYVEYYQNNLDTLSQVSAQVPEADRPRVYYAADGLLNTEGSGSITNSWMEAGGGINVATENGIEGTFIDIDAETLLGWDPDIIILRDAEYYDELFADPVLAPLTAVQNKQVYVAPKGIYNWAVRASEAAIMPLWAATVISPELFPDLDIRQETWDFHNFYYGMDLSDEQIDQILNPAGV